MPADGHPGRGTGSADLYKLTYSTFRVIFSFRQRGLPSGRLFCVYGICQGWAIIYMPLKRTERGLKRILNRKWYKYPSKGVKWLHGANRGRKTHFRYFKAFSGLEAFLDVLKLLPSHKQLKIKKSAVCLILWVVDLGRGHDERPCRGKGFGYFPLVFRVAPCKP